MNQDGLAACVRAAQGGSLRDFEILVQRFQDMAVGYSRVLLNDFHLAEDAAQDAFVQAYLRLGQLQNTEAFPGWFRQIVYSCCMRYRRGRKQEMVPLETVAYLIDPSPLPDAALAHKEWAVLLDQALASLNEAEKTVLTLHYIREHSLREMATFLEVSPTTIKNRLRSAKQKMHGRLLTMARKHMAQEAPSQDKTFARNVLDKVEANCHDSASALVGSIHGIFNAAEIDGSLAKVSSLLGYSFHFCIRPEGAITEHHSVIEWELVFRVLDRLGFKSQHFQTYLAEDWIHLDGTPNQLLSTEELSKFREDTWDAVCASIDRGLPAIAWCPMTEAQREEGVGGSEWGLLAGYDEEQRTYTVHHRWRSNKAYTVPYDGFGHIDDAGWYYVIVFGDHTPPDEQAIVTAALVDAVTYANGTYYDKDTCCYPVAAVGFAAYEVWRDALVAGLPDTRSVRNNANELKLNRQNAALFLRESAELFDTPVAQTLSDASACYDMEVAVLTEVRNLARAAYEAGKFSPAHRRETIAGVAAALEADKLAIRHIESALKML